MAVIDPIALAQALIQRRSVTPIDDGAQEVLAQALEGLGFRIERKRFGAVDNLFARWGAGSPHVCFAGHTDVVPPGEGWSVDPFAGEVRDDTLYGRGAVDMKGAIAAMVSAAGAVIAERDPEAGAISFLITADEEGPAIDGTKPMLEWLWRRGERFDACLVGEPTSEAAVGDVIKHGRRGSLNAVVRAQGVQGHVAYPAKAANPVSAVIDLLAQLRLRILDSGAEGFDPSNLEITTIDVGNPTHNVIPAQASAKFNIRFNTKHSGESLTEWIESLRVRIARQHPKVSLKVDIHVTGEPFLTAQGPLTALAAAAAQHATGRAPRLSTSGGTSDARFIHRYCPVVELGLRNDTAHQRDERAPLEDIRTLSRIYAAFLRTALAGGGETSTMS